MTKVHQIRQEFDEPFRDVVKGFAAMGYSRRATASILGIEKEWFRTLCKRYAPDAPWKSQKDRRDDCKPRAKHMPINNPLGINGTTKKLIERAA